MIDYRSTATPRETTPDGALVFCRFDEIMPVETLRPNPNNPNGHSESQVQLLADIIRATGWRAPITVSNQSGMITKGHGRRLAALAAGFTHVPVEFQDYASEEEEQADLVADNRIAELADMNTDQLAAMLSSIGKELPLELAGFSQDGLDALLGEMADEIDIHLEEDEDFDDTPPLEPNSQLGDVWILGRHRLVCGDSTKLSTIETVMDGNLADLLLTDPPYNVEYTGKTKDALTIENDSMKDGEFREFLTNAFKVIDSVLKPGGGYFIFGMRTPRGTTSEELAGKPDGKYESA